MERQIGRTNKMLLSAVLSLLDGNNVSVVGMNGLYAMSLCNIAQDILASLRLDKKCVFRGSSIEFNDKKMLFVGYGARNKVGNIFIDNSCDSLITRVV